MSKTAQPTPFCAPRSGWKSHRGPNVLGIGCGLAGDRAFPATIEFSLDGTILTANENFLRVMGYPLAEIVGRHHRMFVDGSDRDTPAYARFWADLAAGAFKAGQFKRLSKGGQEVWIQASYDPVLNASGKPCKIIKFAADITSQKRGLADLEGQIAAISRSNAVISFALDGTILDANDNFLKAMGYRLEEVKGRHHSMFVEAAQRGSAAYAQFWADLAAGRYFSAEFKRVAKGGAEVWIQASYNPILDPSGKPFQVVKFATDVTARVRAQQTLSTSINTSAAGAEELNASIGEIAENMARSRGAATSALELSHSAEGVVGRLGGAAQAMNGVVAAINGITSQINLLALNATIEAARAGEAGRGFAVVANEVKQLAGQARAATESISREIGQLRSISEEVSVNLGKIGGSIDQLATSVVSTSAAVEEQSAVTREISAALQRAAAEADKMASAA